MKLDEGEAIVDVQIAAETDDVLLTTAAGQCIRFPVTDVRVFQGRTSMGVRGIGVENGDKVISLSILHHFDAAPAERAAYLKQSGAIRRAATGEDIEPAEPTVEAVEAEEADVDASLSSERYADMGGAEQFVLTVTEFGYGKLSSSYEFRISGRGGKGIRATDISKLGEIGHLIAAFPVDMSDQIMLVSNGGQLIRVPGRRHPHHQPRVEGRARVFHQRRRARGVGRAAGRGERRERAEHRERGLSARPEDIPVSLDVYLVFVGASVLLVLFPGPNVALIVGTSLRHGAHTGLITVAGVGAGIILQLAAVAAGLSWIVDVFSRHFDLIRYLGAAYLIILGLQQLVTARADPTAPPVPLSRERALARGFAVAFANPKTLIFHAAFLPQFLPLGHGSTSALWLLAATYAVLAICGDALWALSAARVRAVLGGPARRVADKASGAILLGGAVALLVAARR